MYISHLHSDGYRVSLVEDQNGEYVVLLEVVARTPGAAPCSTELYRLPAGQPRRAEAQRILHLVSALCRFRNCGGSPEGLGEAVTRFEVATSGQGAVLPAMSVPPGLELAAALETIERINIYAKTDGRYLLAVEGSYTDDLALDEVREYLEDP